MLLQFSDELLCRVEGAVGIFTTCGAPLGLFKVVESALFAKVMPTLCHDGMGERVFADVALEGEVVLVRAVNLVLVVVFVVLTVRPGLHLSLQLPPKLVVRAVVHELARVAEAAETRLLEVLANVGGVVPSAINMKTKSI